MLSLCYMPLLSTRRGYFGIGAVAPSPLSSQSVPQDLHSHYGAGTSSVGGGPGSGGSGGSISGGGATSTTGAGGAAVVPGVSPASSSRSSPVKLTSNAAAVEFLLQDHANLRRPYFLEETHFARDFLKIFAKQELSFDDFYEWGRSRSLEIDTLLRTFQLVQTPDRERYLCEELLSRVAPVPAAPGGVGEGGAGGGVDGVARVPTSLRDRLASSGAASTLQGQTFANVWPWLKLTEGETVYVVSSRWFRQWRLYVGWDPRRMADGIQRQRDSGLRWSTGSGSGPGQFDLVGGAAGVRPGESGLVGGVDNSSRASLDFSLGSPGAGGPPDSPLGVAEHFPYTSSEVVQGAKQHGTNSYPPASAEDAAATTSGAFRNANFRQQSNAGYNPGAPAIGSAYNDDLNASGSTTAFLDQHGGGGPHQRSSSIANSGYSRGRASVFYGVGASGSSDRPAAIDNWELENRETRGLLRANLVAGQDFELVPEEMWMKLQGW